VIPCYNEQAASLPTKPQSFHLLNGETRCSAEAIMRWVSSRGGKEIFRRRCAG
jgi:hypothetical protein